MRPAPIIYAFLAALVVAAGCRTAAPPIRFAPAGTELARLRSEYPLTDAERRALTPETFRSLTQEQVDQIYLRLASGPIPDGPFRGDLFFPRDRDGRARIRDLADPALPAAGAHRRDARRASRAGVLERQGVLPVAGRSCATASRTC